MIDAPSTLSYAESQRRPSKHPVGLLVVAALHIALGYALVNGLARKIVDVVKAPIETKIIEEVKPPPPPPPENLPPPPKNLPPPPSFVPPPEVQVAQPQVQAPTITTTTVAPPPTEVKIAPAPTPAPPAPAVHAQPKPAIVDVKACAPTADDYPPAAARAEATGTTRVRFTIDATGALSKAEVVHSAGPSREHKMLDRTAVSKLSECKFRPAIDENGKPQGGAFEVEYVWKLD
jgi:periplasmic protein TonB